MGNKRRWEKLFGFPLWWKNGCGTVVSTAASQCRGPGFDSRLGSLSVWGLHILMSVWVSSGCPGFLPHSKDVQVRLIGHAKLTLVSGGLARVNMWGYGIGTWVGLWSVQTGWAEWLSPAL